MLFMNFLTCKNFVRIICMMIFISFSTFTVASADIDYVKILSELDNSKGDRVKAEEINKQGLAAYNKRYFKQAQELWLEAARSDPSWWTPYFNFGCVAALSGQKEKAFIFLEMSLSRDPVNALKSYKADSDLNSLKNFPEYQMLLSKYDKMKNTVIMSDQWYKIRSLIGKSYTNPKNKFGFSFVQSGNKIEFFFGGPGEVGGSIYEVKDCTDNQGATELKMKYDNQESQIRLTVLDEKTVRLDFIKNFEWGFSEKSMDFILIK